MRILVLILLPAALLPLWAQDERPGRDKLFTVSGANGRGVDVWLPLAEDYEVVAHAVAGWKVAPPRLQLPARGMADAVFLSSRAVSALPGEDRRTVQEFIDHGVPVICECGEEALSLVAGYVPVERGAGEPYEFFVYRRSGGGVLRLSVLPGGATAGSAREEIRAVLLREALRQALGEGPAAAVTSLPPGAGEGSWTNLAELRKVWSWVTPEVSCATSPPCWDRNKQANVFTVTADFYKIPDGKVDTDYYLVRVVSHHDANYQVPYLNTYGWCTDGWVGWYVVGRALKIERTDTRATLYEYGPTGTLQQVTISYTLGAALDTQGAGVNGSFSVSYTNGDATVIDRSSLRDQMANWTETFVVPFWGFNVDAPSRNARESFYSERAAIYSTSNPTGGVNLKLSPYALFEKTRIEYGPLCTGGGRTSHRYEVNESRTVTIQKNYAPAAPPSPTLSIPSGSTGLWTNTPLVVNMPAAADRDGDALTYSADFGDGTTGPYGGTTQTHSYRAAGAIDLKARARDTYGAESEWSAPGRYTIKGLDRIQLEGGLTEIPELAQVQFQCRAVMSDGSTRLVTGDSTAGWEGGVMRWGVSSSYASISGTGVLTALGLKGADRVVNITASYTLKGIEKSATQTVILKRVPVEQLVPVITSVVNGASYQAGISGAAWATIHGSNLATTARPWRTEEITGGKLPTVLDEVSVTMNDKPAAVSYVHPMQLNVQIPSGVAPGLVTVRVTTAYGTATTKTQLSEFSPAFFTFGGKYVAALHADYSYLTPYGFFTGLITFPARHGETVLLYGTGFGPTTPELPSGELITRPAPLANAVTVWIGNRVADVQWKGITGAGLWQLNVVIPSGLPAGDNAVVAEIGGLRTQAGVFVSIGGGVM